MPELQLMRALNLVDLQALITRSKISCMKIPLCALR